MSAGIVRALAPTDAVPAHAFIAARVSPRYRARVAEQLDAALAGQDAEYDGIVVAEPGGGELSGLLLSGVVAGAGGVVKLHALAGGDRATLLLLLESVMVSGTARAGRMVICEMADDSSFAMLRTVLLQRGFTREGRIADFFAEGIALDLMIWRA